MHSQVRFSALVLRQAGRLLNSVLEGVASGLSWGGSCAVAAAECVAMVVLGVLLDCIDRRAFLQEQHRRRVGGSGDGGRGCCNHASAAVQHLRR